VTWRALIAVACLASLGCGRVDYAASVGADAGADLDAGIVGDGAVRLDVGTLGDVGVPLDAPADTAIAIDGDGAPPGDGGDPTGTAYDPYVCTDTLPAGGDVQAFVDSLAAGEVGCLESGTSVAGGLLVRSAGITLASVPGGRATLEITFFNIERGADDVALKRLDIVTSEVLALRIYGDRALVEQCYFTNRHASGDGACLAVGGSMDTPDGVLRGNRFEDCGNNDSNLNQALAGLSCTNLTVVDNVFTGGGAYSIQLYPDANDTIVQHNVIDGSNEYSVRGSLVADGTSERHTIEHNIFMYTATTAVQLRVGSGHAVRNNCFWANVGGDISGTAEQTGNVVADPELVDRAARDYRLAASSPCLAVVEYDTAARIALGW
jgi:hypothetical protein